MPSDSSEDSRRSIEPPETFIDGVARKVASRRGFMSRSAALGVGAFTLGGSGVVGAAGGDENSGGQQNMDELTDVEILNYALTLERLEANFYTKGLQKYDENDFGGVQVTCPCDTPSFSVYDLLVDVREHEQAHVDFLVNVLEKLGAEPAPACEYDFGYETPCEFLDIARALETTGVSAYLGVIAEIDEPAYTTAAGTIATVEARHSATLNLVNGMSPYPRARDDPKPMEEILKTVDNFIANCPAAKGGQMEDEGKSDGCE